MVFNNVILYRKIFLKINFSEKARFLLVVSWKRKDLIGCLWLNSFFFLFFLSFSVEQNKRNDTAATQGELWILIMTRSTCPTLVWRRNEEKTKKGRNKNEKRKKEKRKWRVWRFGNFLLPPTSGFWRIRFRSACDTKLLWKQKMWHGLAVRLVFAQKCRLTEI